MEQERLLRITRIFTYLMNWDYNPWGYERYEEGTEYKSKPCSLLSLRLAQDVPFGKAQDEKKGELEGMEWEASPPPSPWRGGLDLKTSSSPLKRRLAIFLLIP